MTSQNQGPPADFQSYWQELLEELASIPAAPEVEELPIRSTDYTSCYSVHLSSVGPYRIFGYLSIPNGEGPFPARCYLPRYATAVEPIPQGAPNALRGRYVVLSVGVRGSRMAGQPYTADIPGWYTDGIDDPQSYVFRGIVADCCRGLEYLVSRPEVDSNRVVAIGNDLALITAAPDASRHPCGVQSGPLLPQRRVGADHRVLSLGGAERLSASTTRRRGTLRIAPSTTST